MINDEVELRPVPGCLSNVTDVDIAAQIWNLL
jgi:hypothetical protein